jgi:hypothetical protein
MNLNSKSIRILIVSAVALLLCSVAQADVLYNLSLPSSTPGISPGVNAPDPINSSYLPTENPTTTLLGGDVYNDPIANSNITWDVTSLTAWVVGSTPLGSATDLASGPEFPSGLTLYGGAYAGPSSVMSQLGTPNTLPSGQVQYTSSYEGTGTNYLSTLDGSNYYAIWQVTFTGLTIAIGPGTDYAFALRSTGGDPGVALHLTSSCLTGGPGNTNDCNSLGVMNFVRNIAGWYTVNGAYPFGDVNVELEGVGIGVLGLVRRRRG